MHLFHANYLTKNSFYILDWGGVIAL